MSSPWLTAGGIMTAHAFICWLCDFESHDRRDIEAHKRDTGHRAVADLAATGAR